MKFKNLQQLLRNFGFQVEDSGGFEGFLSKIGGEVSFCWIDKTDLRWYIPQKNSASYQGHYHAEPVFSVAPDNINKDDPHYVIYSFPMSWTEYDDLTLLVSFLQSGFVDGFYIEGNFYLYPEIIAQDLSVLKSTHRKEKKNVQDFIDALTQYPEEAILHNYIGRLYWLENTVEEASKYFVNACEKDPYYAEPFANMGSLLWEKGNKERAFQMFYESMLRNPFDESLQDQFLQAGLDLNEIERMNHCIGKVHEYYPGYSGLLYIEAMLLEKLGKEKESISVMEKMHEKHPGDERAKNFLNELRGL